MTRVTATATIDIARPPAQVYARLVDVRGHAAWSPKPYRTQGLVAGVPVTVGTRFTSHGWLPNDKDHRNDVEVTRLDPPTCLILTATDAGQTFVTTFTLTATSGGCHLERVLDMPEPTGILGIIFPVIRAALIQPDMKKGLATLKALVENG